MLKNDVDNTLRVDGRTIAQSRTEPDLRGRYLCCFIKPEAQPPNHAKHFNVTCRTEANLEQDFTFYSLCPRLFGIDGLRFERNLHG